MGWAVVFMEFYKITPQQCAVLFGANAVGIIVVSQVNSRVLHRYPAARILKAANLIQCASGLALVVAAVTRAGVLLTWAPLFTYVSCIGLTFPNGSALSMAKHARIAGMASALLGTNQFGLAAIATAILGIIPSATPVPMAAIIAICRCPAATITFAAPRGQAALG